MKKFKAIMLLIVCFCTIYFIHIKINGKTYNIFTIKQETLDEIVIRFDNNSLTRNDKITLKRIYNNIIFFGGFFYPEASKILKHYIFGNGDDMEIVSKYFFESSFIKTILKNNDKEIIGPVTLRINENPRIAYAVNGFYIRRHNKETEIYQEINFAGREDRNTYTTFKIINKEIKIPDRLIRAFEAEGGCKGYTVIIRAWQK